MKYSPRDGETTEVKYSPGDGETTEVAEEVKEVLTWRWRDY